MIDVSAVYCGGIMNFARRRLAKLGAPLVAIMILAASAPAAWSQAARTIRLVVPYQPGAAVDVLARLLGEEIGRTRGPAVVVENRPGGGSVIGTEAVARAAPDGNTLLIAVSDFVITPHLRKLSYSALTSFEPVCYLVDLPLLLVVNSTSPYRTLADLINAARARPGDLTLAANGPATAYHIAFETLRRAAKVDITFVPYPGTAGAVTAVMGDHVTAYLGSYAAVMEQLGGGKLRALATPSRARLEPLPYVPTIAESGVAGYEAVNWIAVFAPAKTPRDTVAQLAGWLAAAMDAPEVKAKLGVQGLLPAVKCGADFAGLVNKEYEAYGLAVREANMRAE
jgi:tripartite-type tricarboxylate transporter receptor subunit TctC